MKIGIDISQTAHKGTGVGRYTENLVKSLLEHDSKNTYILMFSSLRRNPPPMMNEILKKYPNVFLKQYKLPPMLLSMLWNEAHIMPLEKLVGDVDIFIASDWTHPPADKAQTITIVHDLIPFLHPETSTRNTKIDVVKGRISPNIVDTHKKRMKWASKECAVLVADSKSTEADIKKVLKVPEKKVQVIYPYITTEQLKDKEAKKIIQELHLKKPYILTVGKIEPRKNVASLIKAYAASDIHKDVDLVIVGASGWGDQTFDIPEKIKSNIHLLGYVHEEKLTALYQKAEGFIMPSLYEGFGYPLIEAMSLGCPTAASDVSSLGELGKGTSLLFDPKSLQDISKTLHTLAKDTKKRKELIKKGLEFSMKFNSDTFAAKWLQLLNKVHDYRN